MARRVKLNYAGLKEIADSPEMRATLESIGNELADSINMSGYTAKSGARESEAELRAEVEMGSDPAVARVVVKHPAALIMQAKHGIFTRAAAEVGLEVKPPKL